MNSANRPIRYYQVAKHSNRLVGADVIVEAPVSITVNSEVWLTFMCTPVDLEALAVGFLYNEGVIDNIDQVADVRLCAAGDNVDVWLKHSAQKPEKWRRTSGCTGGFTALDPADTLPAYNAGHLSSNGGVISPAVIHSLVSQLFEAQQIYRETGGVHTSGISDGQRIILACEDIGRHNTLDKLAGRMLLERTSLPKIIVLTTGRISSEMLQKSARMGATIVVSRTSPSSLSIELAERFKITLIGYARRDRFNVYTQAQRIAGENLVPSDQPGVVNTAT
jgi:FdhD protein